MSNSERETTLIQELQFMGVATAQRMGLPCKMKALVSTAVPNR